MKSYCNKIEVAKMEKCKYCVFEDEDGNYVQGKCTCPNKSNKSACLVQLGQSCTYYTI